MAKEKPKKSSINREPGFWLLMCPLLAFVLVISYCNIRSLDLWWHLKTGEWIWQHRSIPKVDPFSYTAPGQPWVSHEWLFGLISYLVYRATGLAGIVGLKAGLIALVFGLAGWNARLRGARASITFLVLAAAYLIARLRFTERPELFSLPLAAAFFLLYELARGRPRLLYSVPLLQLLWANIHGGTAVLGWALGGSLTLDRVFEKRRNERTPWPTLLREPSLRPYWTALAGLIAAAFLNPHTAKALFYGVLRAESPLDNKEFQSFFTLWNAGADLSLVLFVAFAALFALFLVWHRSSAPVLDWVLFPLLLLAALTYFRFRTLFVFLLAPSLAWHISSARWLSRVRWWLPVSAAVMLMIYDVQIERDTYIYRFGSGVHDGLFPTGAVRFISRSGLSGRMFNTYGIGGYLMWNLQPEHAVFIDGREDVYLTAGVLDEYVRCFDSREHWQALVDKYGIDYAILRYPEEPPATMERSLDSLAFPRKEWGLVYFDDTAAVYIRRNGKNDSTLQKCEIRSVEPFQLSSYMDPIIRDPDRLQQFLEEINSNLREHPSSYRDQFILGILSVKRGPQFLSDAIVHFQKASAINPDFGPAHTNLGNIYQHLGRFAEAESEFRKAGT